MSKNYAVVTFPKELKQEIYKALKENDYVVIKGIGRFHKSVKDGIKFFDPYHKEWKLTSKTFVTFKPFSKLRRAAKEK